MLLVIDNFDSFTYNLVHAFEALGARTHTVRNDSITPDEMWSLEPDALVISPGPCDPDKAGVSLAAIDAAVGRLPIFGVCLGHQCLGQYFGGRIIKADRLMHGKTSPVLHQGKGIFAGLPSPFPATRYHSLLVERETFPEVLEITAETAEGEIMGLQHRELPIWGVQFHPESLATTAGLSLVRNFLELVKNQPAVVAS
jgi:anthranilate synthase component 2